MTVYRGLIRKLDGLGRVSIPAEYRKMLGLCKDDEVEMFLTDKNEILIKACTDKLSLQNKKRRKL